MMCTVYTGVSLAARNLAWGRCQREMESGHIKPIPDSALYTGRHLQMLH